MDLPVRFVSCTATTKEGFEETPLGLSLNKLKTINSKLTSTIYYGNNKGLSVRYNQALKESPEDLIVFLHDDVSIEDLFVFEKIKPGLELYSAFGLAGSAYFNFNRRVLGWCDEAIVNDKFKYCGGSVWHPLENKAEHSNEAIVFNTSFGPCPRLVLVVDGLFIAVDRRKLDGITFDEDFKSDFYDLSFSMRLKHAKKLLGIMPINVRHMSHGAAIGGPKFLEQQKIFTEKYGKEVKG